MTGQAGTSAPQAVYEASGSPPVDGTTLVLGGGVCWQCGGSLVLGVPVHKWMGKGYTSQTDARAAHSSWICPACVFVSSRTSPVPGRPPKPGKKMGGNFRNYSHMAELGRRGWRYVNASKGEKDLLRGFLLAPHVGSWFCAVADSGQKHVLPFAPVNPAGSCAGVVRFEESDVAVPESAGEDVAEITELLTAGGTKDGILSGQHSPYLWQRCPDHVRRFEDEVGRRLRGGGWFRLAVWLAQRDEERAAARLAAEKAERAKRKKRGK